MYRIYFTNHQYFSIKSHDTLQDAEQAARKHGFEAAIYRGSDIVATWSFFTGLRVLG